MKKARKLVALTAIITLLMLVLAGCGGKTAAPEQQPADNSGQSQPETKQAVRVGLLTGVAGLGDKSFNDLAYEGAKKAELELGIALKVIEPPDLASTEELLRQLAKDGNQLVIGVGFDMLEPMSKVADEFPDTKFAIVDAVVEKPNVASLVPESVICG